MNSSTRTTILLAEDHGVVRAGLRRVLDAEIDIEVVGEACTGRQAVEMAKKLRPSIVVMDVSMPMLNGIEATRQIVGAIPGVKTLILSAHSDDAYIDRALEAGASGYLVKQSSALTLIKAIREIQRGGRFLDAEVAKRHRNRNQEILDRKGRFKRKDASLSSRETEVLQLIAEGSANKQIAPELGISVKTVEKHRDSLMRKLDIHDTASLTRYAISAGIIECEVKLTIV